VASHDQQQSNRYQKHIQEETEKKKANKPKLLLKNEPFMEQSTNITTFLQRCQEVIDIMFIDQV